MVKRSTSLLPLSLVILLGIAAFPPPAQGEVTVSFGVFLNGLSPYGTWTDHPRLGMVWSPSVAPGWRPYTDGRWLFVEDAGWTFVGDEAWAWAPYHYGNWYLDPVLGWTWVPGYEWSPARVDWVAGDDWVGWAPLPPRAVWIAGPRLAPRYYTFVEERFFGAPSLVRYVAPVSRNVSLIAVTRPISTLSFGTIERVSVLPIERVRLVDVSTPLELRVAPLRRGEVKLFRPHFDRRAAFRPWGGGRERGKFVSRERFVSREAFVRRSHERRPAVERSLARSFDGARGEVRGRGPAVIDRGGRGRTDARVSTRHADRRLEIRRSGARGDRPRALGRERLRSSSRQDRPRAHLRTSRGGSRDLRVHRDRQRPPQRQHLQRQHGGRQQHVQRQRGGGGQHVQRQQRQRGPGGQHGSGSAAAAGGEAEARDSNGRPAPPGQMALPAGGHSPERSSSSR